MKITITGATGFVGGAMVRHFAQKGYKVTALGRTKNPSEELLNHAEYVRADIAESVPKIESDICIHCAALATDRAGYNDYFETNFRGTERVFNAVQAQKIIQISTSSVYDFNRKIHLENEPVNLRKLSNYGKTKRMAEDFLRKQQQSGHSIFVLRPRAIYGVGDRVLLPRILDLVRNGKIRVPGDMRIQISLTHIQNLIQATEKCITSGAEFEIYNVADEDVYQLREVVEKLVTAIFQKEIPIKSVHVSLVRNLAMIFDFLKIPSRLTPFSVASVTQDNMLNIEKIQRELNYAPKYNFHDSVKEIVDWVHVNGMVNP